MFILEGAKKNEKDIIGLNVYCSCPPGKENNGCAARPRAESEGKGILAGCQQSSPSTWATARTAELTPTNSIVVTAKQLTEDFSKDKDAAKQEIPRKRKWWSMGRWPTSWKRTASSAPSSRAVKPPLVVSCTLRQEEFRTLKKGQPITIKGDCSLFADNEVTVNTAFLVKKDK